MFCGVPRCRQPPLNALSDKGLASLCLTIEAPVPIGVAPTPELQVALSTVGFGTPEERQLPSAASPPPFMSQLACCPVWPSLYAASKYYVVKNGSAESGRATFMGASFNKAIN